MLRLYNTQTGEVLETSGQRQARSMLHYIANSQDFQNWKNPFYIIVESNNNRLAVWFKSELERKYVK